MTNKAIIACACLFSATFTTSAFAQGETVTRRVSYADLDIMTKAGAATLDRRIARAIRDVCGENSMRDVSQMRREQRCRRSAESAVRPQLDTAFAAARIRAGTVQTVSVQPDIRFGGN
ncbi:MAG: UrcA family protein [Sphingomonadaceae bacterium]